MAEVSIENDNNRNITLEYRIPESLLCPETGNTENVVQFRIPVSDTTTVNSAVNEAIEEARVVIGKQVPISEETIRQLRESTEMCLRNNLNSYCCLFILTATSNHMILLLVLYFQLI